MSLGFISTRTLHARRSTTLQPTRSRASPYHDCPRIPERDSTLSCREAGTIQSLTQHNFIVQGRKEWSGFASADFVPNFCYLLMSMFRFKQTKQPQDTSGAESGGGGTHSCSRCPACSAAGWEGQSCRQQLHPPGPLPHNP